MGDRDYLAPWNRPACFLRWLQGKNGMDIDFIDFTREAKRSAWHMMDCRQLQTPASLSLQMPHGKLRFTMQGMQGECRPNCSRQLGAAFSLADVGVESTLSVLYSASLQHTMHRQMRQMCATSGHTIRALDGTETGTHWPKNGLGSLSQFAPYRFAPNWVRIRTQWIRPVTWLSLFSPPASCGAKP